MPAPWSDPRWLAGAAAWIDAVCADLHDGNVFAAGGRHRVFDWGDAYLGTPFALLLVLQESVARRLETTVADRRIARLRAAYLEPWTATHDRAPLEHLALLAVRSASVGRALAWRRALIDAGPADLATWGTYPAQWLAALLEPPPW